MPTPKRGPRLGGSPAHQKQILANLASDLFRHGRVKTTLAKAKMLRPYAERLITKAKQGDLHNRRQVLAKLHDRDVVAYLFEDVAPRFSDRNGGYTRILKLGPRKGDNAPMALIELVERGDEAGDEVIEEAKVGRSRGLFGRRRRQRAEAGAGAGIGTALLEEDDEDEFDVEDDEQVAAAIKQATGGQDDEADDDDVDGDDADADDSTEGATSSDSVDSSDDEDGDDDTEDDDKA